MEFRAGPTEHAMRGSGVRTKLMARASSGMWMEMCSTVSGRMTRRTAMESTLIKMELNIKDIGRMTCRMAGVSRHGQMAPSTKDTTKKVRSMGMAPTPGMMGLAMWETG